MGSRNEGHERNTAGQQRDRQRQRTAARHRRRPTNPTTQQREQSVRVGVAAAAFAAAALIAWLVLTRRADDIIRPNALPGPEGGPSIAQDVGTLVGQPAPAFTLADAEGTTYTVTPGQGRPLVLISHMGIT